MKSATIEKVVDICREYNERMAKKARAFLFLFQLYANSSPTKAMLMARIRARRIYNEQPAFKEWEGDNQADLFTVKHAP